MAYINQTVEEILVLAGHGALKKTQKNGALIEALGQDILGRWMMTIFARPCSCMSATSNERGGASETSMSRLNFAKPMMKPWRWLTL